ncbi:winged helix-turn-helix domain-containing protein [Gordonia sp. ABSL1-1]|uniref:winged helix-turn-helix domain-containing protein n=1 Tax=Gordonia sp. ABSL1-1 TaxID=3053923 RepID=UPI0025727875|nr:winged helix-turn-helix domain-containing protein [Gordonia sp. ABSL1-1]MDL9935368.1 winged helix-turn-helix domain-containing protein [Gordonia sp. ABSL1-1]
MIVDAALAGLPRTLIARLIGVSEPDVSRTLASDKAAHDGNLHPLSLTPLDVIDQRDAGEIDSTLMMERLRKISYTNGHVPMVAGMPTDAYVRGSWDDIEFAFQQDKLTFDEYSALFEAHRQQLKSAL